MQHPRQREMWDGLTAGGCLGFIVLVLAITIAIEWVLG